MAEEIVITSWESHVGTACIGVNWDRHSLSMIRAAVTCVGGPCLASLCRHLAQDYRNWSSGMPDLLLWRFHDDYRGEAKLVEVKSSHDRLSEQQRAWLLLLMDCGFNVEVCKVSARSVSKWNHNHIHIRYLMNVWSLHGSDAFGKHSNANTYCRLQCLAEVLYSNMLDVTLYFSVTIYIFNKLFNYF